MLEKKRLHRFIKTQLLNFQNFQPDELLSCCLAFDLNLSLSPKQLGCNMYFWSFLGQKLSVDIRHFRVCIFENPETTENFHKPIFRGIKTSYLISSSFLGILCVQNTFLEVLLKVINKHLLLLLESDFSGYYSQDGT